MDLSVGDCRRLCVYANNAEEFEQRRLFVPADFSVRRGVPLLELVRFFLRQVARAEGHAYASEHQSLRRDAGKSSICPELHHGYGFAESGFGNGSGLVLQTKRAAGSAVCV